ncbi:hypothetical protein HK405_002451, partial [Cladochytrium tenue]
STSNDNEASDVAATQQPAPAYVRQTLQAWLDTIRETGPSSPGADSQGGDGGPGTTTDARGVKRTKRRSRVSLRAKPAVDDHAAAAASAAAIATITDSATSAGGDGSSRTSGSEGGASEDRAAAAGVGTPSSQGTTTTTSSSDHALQSPVIRQAQAMTAALGFRHPEGPAVRAVVGAPVQATSANAETRLASPLDIGAVAIPPFHIDPRQLGPDSDDDDDDNWRGTHRSKRSRAHRKTGSGTAGDGGSLPADPPATPRRRPRRAFPGVARGGAKRREPGDADDDDDGSLETDAAPARDDDESDDGTGARAGPGALGYAAEYDGDDGGNGGGDDVNDG